MEGVAGIVDWSQCRAPGVPYEEGRRLLLGEVNAAIEGALAAGATEIICNDSHGTMNNLDPAALAGQASYVSGRHKPLYMMQGLEAARHPGGAYPDRGHGRGRFVGERRRTDGRADGEHARRGSAGDVPVVRGADLHHPGGRRALRSV